jgi:hypothetical protein
MPALGLGTPDPKSEARIGPAMFDGRANSVRPSPQRSDPETRVTECIGWIGSSLRVGFPPAIHVNRYLEFL